MGEPGDDLHEGGKIVELDALGGNLYEEFDQFTSVDRVTLFYDTPHEEERHLYGRERVKADMVRKELKQMW